VNRVRILNADFDGVTLSEAVDRAATSIRTGARGYVCTVNAAVLMMMRRDPRLQRFVDRAALVVADGQPIVWTSRLAPRPLPERIAGIDLVDALAARAAAEGFSVYLLGSRRPVVEAAATRLRAAHPRLRLAGVADGYFDAAHAGARAAAIRQSAADILIVGMGVPRQERFIEEHWQELGVHLAIGVGGSFDVMAGIRRRAPRWCQRSGLEWLWRLAQEPRRLGRRYVVTNTEFVGVVIRTLLVPRRRSA
jgi:N-acetylglucosaminyldiphosphoundecaprenol N-acetyl-beta-D-mannosaminyltransferase